jgi:hypothetical protein
MQHSLGRNLDVAWQRFFCLFRPIWYKPSRLNALRATVAWSCCSEIEHHRSLTEACCTPRNRTLEPMNRRDLVLAMLACADGRPYTPVQIQKAIFIVCDKVPSLVDRGPPFHFEPYDYGPFDAAVYGEIELLASQGLATIAPSGSGRWNNYAATDAGLIHGQEVLDRLEEREYEFLHRISGWVQTQSFSSLVRSIYEAYPAMRANSIFRG